MLGYLNVSQDSKLNLIRATVAWFARLTSGSSIITETETKLFAEFLDLQGHDNDLCLRILWNFL